MHGHCIRCFVAALTAGMVPAAASAHVTLEIPQASAGGSYKAVLRVPHGCQGSATVRLRVRIPEGVFAVKPQPKAGWQLSTVQGEYASSYAFHGSTLRAGVREIAWSGGSLPDDQYDEFVFVGHLAADLQPGTKLYFPVVQECRHGVARWIDMPSSADDQERGEAPSPAPAVTILPAP